MCSEIANLQSEIIRLMCVDEKPDIRKTCIINLKIDDKNFRDLIQRTREINPEIRLKIYNKLINEGIYLFSKDLGSIYKVCHFYIIRTIFKDKIFKIKFLLKKKLN